MAKGAVLITGCAGLVGSHLVEKFLENDFQVVGVDNYLTGRESNIKHLFADSNFKFVEADVTKRFDFENPFGGNFASVLHFACPASPIDFSELPIEILEVDSIGTLKALEFAKAHGASFLIASTSECYGDPLQHPQKETYWGNVNPIGPRSCYDETKRFAEAATMAYHRKYGMKTHIVRIFNTYGPRMRMNDGRVVPALCTQALKGEEMTIHGNGEQTRSFCFVDDLVEGIYRLSQSNEHLPVNIGNPGEFTILEFAEAIMEVLEKKVPLKHLPGREDDPRRRRPDITKAREILGWEPKVTLKEGLKKTLDGFKQELAGN